MRLSGLLVGFAFAVVTACALFGCDGCKGPKGSEAQRGVAGEDPGPATFRLYATSDLAGALEPCGCVKDQLGGLDHLAALMAHEAGSAKASALVEVGPLFFLDTTLRGDRRAQELAKAGTLARALNGLGLVAFAPGDNDFAAGDEELARLISATGATGLFANSSAHLEGFSGTMVRDIGGVRVGFVGVAAPKSRASTAAAAAVDAGLAALKQQGAAVLVALVAAGRGEAKRIADLHPELTAVIVGSPGGAGEANTETPAGERLGNTVIVETGNHLQTVVALDFWVRAGKATFADASSLGEPQRRRELFARVQDLRGKLADAAHDGAGERPETRELADELAAKRKELARIEEGPPPPDGQSFLRYRVEEISASAGVEAKVSGMLRDYYKQVNDANKLAFAGKAPRALAKGEPGFAGIARCSTCHADARQVWDGTAHAHAYKTLAKDFKEYNLDCVSCHVTGYDLPGGSTVTAVETLRDVQCEVCHGPGGDHAKDPVNAKIPVPRPAGDTCLACHHPPHVHSFDASAKLPLILGPGHGRPRH